MPGSPALKNKFIPFLQQFSAGKKSNGYIHSAANNKGTNLLTLPMQLKKCQGKAFCNFINRYIYPMIE